VTQHEVFFHYCGFNIAAARVFGRWKVFWLMQNWYTNDHQNRYALSKRLSGTLFS
jgi:hypothetical protein